MPSDAENRVEPTLEQYVQVDTILNFLSERHTNDNDLNQEQQAGDLIRTHRLVEARKLKRFSLEKEYDLQLLVAFFIHVGFFDNLKKRAPGDIIK